MGHPAGAAPPGSHAAASAAGPHVTCRAVVPAFFRALHLLVLSRGVTACADLSQLGRLHAARSAIAERA
jgi:hypothetical protein